MLTRRVEAAMKPSFGTAHNVILITCAGAGGLEAAVVNVLSPGDPIPAVTMGSFGDRFAKIAETDGAAVTRLEIESGQAPSPAAVREAAAAIPCGMDVHPGAAVAAAQEALLTTPGGIR